MGTMRARLDEAKRLLREAEGRPEEERARLVHRAGELLREIVADLREGITERERDITSREPPG